MLGLLIEDFETAGFNSFEWEFSGSAPWTICDENPYEGSYCMKSGNIGSNATSVISINVDVLADGEISFYKKVSSELDYDFLIFKIDNIVMDSWSGEVDWSNETYAVATGNHTFSWIYQKDMYMTGGDDCAWVDYILFPPHSSSVGITEKNVDSFRTSVHPNPFNGDLSFSMDLSSAANVSIDIFNAYGQYIGNIVNQKKLPEGTYEFKADLNNLPGGIYFCRMRLNNEIFIHKLIHSR